MTPNTRQAETKQMTISPVFFKRERDNYSDWAFAFWRELFQNSDDARSSVISVGINQACHSKKAIIEHEDNGIGMTRETLENVYFKLGETTKHTADTIGGFGKARIVTCFAHDSYSLASKDWYVEGVGSQYTVHGMPMRPERGVKVRVNVDATDRYDDSVDMMEALRKFLSMAQMQTNVMVMGQRWTGWCYKRRKVRRLSFGTVHTNSKGYWQNRLIVRVNGVPMFHRYIQAPAQVVVEIDENVSREILLSNRDSLTNEAQAELDNFIQTLAVDKNSALRSNTRTVKRFGEGAIVTRRRKKTTKKTRKEPAPEPVAQAAAALTDATPEVTTPEDAEVVSQIVSSTHCPPVAVDVEPKSYEDPDTETVDTMIASAMVYVETDNPKMRKVIPSYQPDAWRVVEWDKRPGKPYMQGRHKRDLLRLWTVAVDEAVTAFLDMTDQEEMAWVPGFCFSDTSLAMRESISEGHAFLFCPVDKDGKMRFHLSKQDDWAQLIADACHEVVHTLVSPHDENYASLLTDLYAKVFADKRIIVRRMKGVLSKGKK